MFARLANLRYLFGSQCESISGEDRCVLRAGHQTWHTKNGNLRWGDSMFSSLPTNCAVNERTGDGVSVGRCWFHTDRIVATLICPRHGDVTEIQRRFQQTGKLGEDPFLRSTLHKLRFSRDPRGA